VYLNPIPPLPPHRLHDEKDTVTGLLLAGVGNVDRATRKSNFLVVDNRTCPRKCLDCFFFFNVRCRDVGERD